MRERGTLIVGSGFTTHNLRWFNPAGGPDSAPPAASSEFDHWAEEAMARGDVDSILDFLNKAPPPARRTPAASTGLRSMLPSALPTAPARLHAKTAIDGFWFGLSKRSWTLT